jgi:hypothetical protein
VGAAVGAAVGASEGIELGCEVAMLGEAEGAVVGPCDVGLLEGIEEGISVDKTLSIELDEARHTVKR